MAKDFNYQNRVFKLENKIESGKLVRTVLNDGGLEFPFTNYNDASDFLVDEYGGSKDEALKILNETESLEGVEVSGTPAQTKPDKAAKKGSSSGKKSEKKEKKEPKEKAEKKEPVKQTFELAGKEVTKTLQTKTILPDQKPIDTQDVKLDDVYGLHIDVYSKKNRTSKLYKIVEGKEVAAYPESVGEIVIENVSLMDVIYAYADKVGMSFSQADKYIKIKRGLLPEPEKKEKKEKVKAEDLKAKTGEADAKSESEAPAKSESEAPADAPQA